MTLLQSVSSQSTGLHRCINKVIENQEVNPLDIVNRLLVISFMCSIFFCCCFVFLYIYFV